MIYGEALTFGRKREFYVTRLKRIEVVASLKAETSLVLHDKQAITNMQPELDLHTPSMMCFTANLEHHGGDIVNMPSGRVFTFASRRNKQKLIQKQALFVSSLLLLIRSRAQCHQTLLLR
ncbi:glyoxalase/bleomycin resistance protein/dioxygenase [Bacillus velezensis M27]|uniref:hypothetical protein n=1 Tax=Bacillus velezensis TaxID=492670 RepID=UPI0002869111|nr:hypothetical protein [Bacillus velezensis]KDN92695.1 glyoxalase [Bacillus amyloliquefaciens]ASF55435.1 glyoxalase [Bacillus velezensis]EKE48510.1 glyoxalase/bleomycin resistance protein/dioxygenase [Bacillus velezensis M27]PAE32815.1 glyoxalase [Bacillus velezensis]URJ72598.1 glyoxalase [Bacillus velezensis]